ncbi:MAG: hypothetical protein KF706_02730 [Chitinophagales bacterium]|nr:hypothetical protein [Chitinophagales bacterium]
MKIFLSNDIPNKAIVYYTLQLIAFNKAEKFVYVTERNGCNISVGIGLENTIYLSEKFFQHLKEKKTDSKFHLNSSGRIVLPNNTSTDYLSTIFYYVNCVQEYFATEHDQHERYISANAAQAKFGIKQNFVQLLIDEFCETVNELKYLKNKKRPSGFLLTHDIDFVYKSKNEDGMFALKNRRWAAIPKLLFNHYVGTPDWLNMHKIVAIEKRFDFTSNFFWLVKKDKQNSDYRFDSLDIQKQLQIIARSGGTNNLHKAIGNTSFDEELKWFTEKPDANRYHFLKFKVNDFKRIEEAEIKIDTSLGFSDKFGFRNSYGLPFMPFDIEENRVLNFIEVPLNIMDRTFFNLRQTPEFSFSQVEHWMKENTNDCIFTINWHNNFFSELTYAGYEKFYIKMLEYFKANNMKCYTMKDLKEEFLQPDFFTMPEHLSAEC